MSLNLLLMLKRNLFPALLWLSLCGGASHAGESPVGRVACDPPWSVHDGDTFRCLSGEQDFPVRIAGIDAPETGQAFWRVSRDLLRTRLAQGAVVDCYKTDERYKRQVCRVSSPDWQDIAEELVRTGLAWHTVKYREEQSQEEQARYANAEVVARSQGLGIWSQGDPQDPGECRALKKQRQKCR